MENNKDKESKITFKYSIEDLYNYLEYDDEIQARYLLNFIKDPLYGDYKFSDKIRATYGQVLCASFTFAESPEGPDYWVDLYHKLQNNIK